MTAQDKVAIENFGQNMYDLVMALVGDAAKAYAMAEKAIYSHTGQRYPIRIVESDGRHKLIILNN